MAVPRTAFVHALKSLYDWLDTQMGTSLSADELNVLDGVTPGTAKASSAVVLDSGLKVSGIKQITLAAGTATVAPIVLTSGTNLTTAAAGAVEFDGKAFYADAVASSRQLVPAEQFCVLTADYSATDTASAQKVFNSSTNGAVTLAASTTYFFEALYKISNTGTTSHTWGTLFDLSGSLSLTDISYTVIGDTRTTSAATIAAASILDISVATVVAVTAASTSATEFVTLLLKGKIAVNAGGILTPQIKASAQPGASGTPGVTVLKGSYFRIWAAGASAVAAVGNWS